MQKKRAVLHWSGGKDCAYALYKLGKQKDVSVDRLFVSLTGKGDRVSVHGVEKSLIEKQAESIGIPVEFMTLPENPSNREYESALLTAMEKFKKEGIEDAVFGDIFLSDVRKYREKLFENRSLKTLFPLWGMSTRKIAENFVDVGFKAKVVSVSGSKLDSFFAGREYNQTFINDLPGSVDPCGENGEFHTYVYDGPIFSKPISIKTGNIVTKLFPSPVRPQENIRIYISGITLIK